VICDTTKKTIQVYKGMEPEPLPAPVHEKLIQIIEKRCCKHESQAKPLSEQVSDS
jgi:hypothetical protein